MLLAGLRVCEHRCTEEELFELMLIRVKCFIIV